MPGGALVPLLGVLSCGALILFLPLVTQLRFLLWPLIGLGIYFAYSSRHSVLHKQAMADQAS